jgi:hypothetical protein
VRITGPDLPNAIEIEDARALQAFAPGTLERGTSLASGTGPDESVLSYLVTRYYGPEQLDQVRYVPNPDGSGRLFADGIVYERFVMRGTEWQPRWPGVVGRWWTPRPETEQALQQILSNPPAHSSSPVAGRQLSDVLPWLPLMGLAFAGLLIGRAAHRTLAR